MSNPVINGPQAPETNPPIEPQNFQPSVFPIIAIAFGVFTTITTGIALGGVHNNYVIGQQVRFVIPSGFGAQQLNGLDGFVIAIPGPNQVTININSLGFNAFIPTPPFGPTPPQILAIGDVSTGPINSQVIPINAAPTNNTIADTTFIPGSFINISPVLAG